MFTALDICDRERQRGREREGVRFKNFELLIGIESWGSENSRRRENARERQRWIESEEGGREEWIGAWKKLKDWEKEKERESVSDRETDRERKLGLGSIRGWSKVKT